MKQTIYYVNFEQKSAKGHLSKSKLNKLNAQKAVHLTTNIDKNFTKRDVVNL